MNVYSKCLKWAGCIGVSALVGCGTTDPVKPAHVTRGLDKSHMVSCQRRFGVSELLVMEVLAAGNALSNWMVTKALGATPSATAQELVRMLATSQRPVVMLSGVDSAVTVATLEAALAELQPRQPGSLPPVCVAGASALPESTAAAARRAGITLALVGQ